MSENRDLTGRLHELDALESHLADAQVVRGRARRILLVVGLPILGILLWGVRQAILASHRSNVGLAGTVIYLRSTVTVWLLNELVIRCQKALRTSCAPGRANDAGRRRRPGVIAT
jgi:hypothetical protein